MAKPPVKRSRASLAKRREAALAYLMQGDAAKASRVCGVPKNTIIDWTHTDWWEEMLNGVRAEAEDKVRAGFARIIEKSQGEVEDRLENGDVRIVQGKKVRVPVSGKDAMTIGAIAYDKQRISLNLPTSIRADTSEQLKNLAAQFAQIAEEERAKRERLVVSEQ